jgi:hypothetical protein
VDIINLSDFCDNMQIVPLETNEMSLIRDINKLIATKDRIYVFDRITAIVLEFDMTGKFIRRFGNKGSGPGEYINPIDFTIDEKRRNLWILDLMQQRLFRYDLDTGDFQKDFRINTGHEEHCDAIAIVGDRIYASNNYFAAGSPQYMLKSCDIDDPETAKNYYLDRSEYLKGLDNYSIIGTGKFIYNEINEYAVYSNKYINQIFKIVPDGVETYIYIASQNNLNEADREDISQAFNGPFMGNPLSSMNKYNSIQDYFETDSHIGFNIIIGMPLKVVIFNKKSKKVIISGFIYYDLLYNEMRPELISYTPFSYADREMIYHHVRSEDIHKLKLAAQEGVLADNIDNIDVLKNLPEDSNPVILISELKD